MSTAEPPCAACGGSFARWTCVLCGQGTRGATCGACLARRRGHRLGGPVALGAGATCEGCLSECYVLSPRDVWDQTYRDRGTLEFCLRWAKRRGAKARDSPLHLYEPRVRRRTLVFPASSVLVVHRNPSGDDVAGEFGDALELHAAEFSQLERPGQPGALWIYVSQCGAMAPAAAQAEWLARNERLKGEDP